MEEHWKSIVLHFSSLVLFVGSGLKMKTIENVFLTYSLFSMILGRCFYTAAAACEYIQYNYGFGMLLTLYTIGTISKSRKKGNWFITF